MAYRIEYAPRAKRELAALPLAPEGPGLDAGLSMRCLACLALLLLPLTARAGDHRTWAVVVGVSDYDNAAVRDLRYADRDARAFAEFLMDAAGGATPRERIFLLTSPEKDPAGKSPLVADRRPTYENIRYALGEFVSKASSDDRMILFIAGHGAADTAKNLYLLACDTDPSQLRVNGYPMWQMKDVIEKFIPCREVLLLVDACHGGGAGEGIASARDVGQDQMEALRQSSSQASGKSVAFLGSSIGSEVSQENESWGGGHGVFTWELLEGLKGAADRDKDGAVSLLELWDYVDEHVKVETKYGQHPDKGNNALFPAQEPLFGARKGVEAPTPPAPAGGSEARLVAELKSLAKNEQGYEEYEDVKTGIVLIRVPAGEFQMGSADGADDEKPVHRVVLDEYLIGKTEVTNAQYRAFVKATGRKEPLQPDDGWGYLNYFGDSRYDDYPVVEVSWEDAKAYCDWAGLALPTEAQWERAARGKDERKHPWGNEEPDASRAQYGKSMNSGDYTKRVGSFPKGASVVGALDMGGNVWEWCADWYGEKYYGGCGDGMRNPTGQDSGSSRVVRGGSWLFSGSGLRGAFRDWDVPGFRFYFGFRVARSPAH